MTTRKQLKGITTKSSAPSNPVKGDLWYECDSTGNLLYGWAWWWDGSLWRSPDQYWEVDVLNLAAPNTALHFFFADHTVAYCFKSYELVSYTFTSQTTSNYWSAYVDFRTSNDTPNTVGIKVNTQSNPANVWTQKKVLDMNTFVFPATSKLVFATAIASTGSPSSISAAFKATYQLINA